MLPEFCYITRILLCDQSSIKVLEFCYVTRIPLHHEFHINWNFITRILLHYVTRIAMNYWNSVIFLEFYYITEFYYISRIPLYCQNSATLHEFCFSANILYHHHNSVILHYRNAVVTGILLCNFIMLHYRSPLHYQNSVT